MKKNLFFVLALTGTVVLADSCLLFAEEASAPPAAAAVAPVVATPMANPPVTAAPATSAAAAATPIATLPVAATPAAAPVVVPTELLLFQDIPSSLTATLTKIAASKIPAAMTIITAKDISTTPARNVYDLLEIYVPGLVTLNHLWPRIGMRGIISDRDTKTLMLLNGQVINDRLMYGVTDVEMSAWDLEDIARIEIIRGPGSVTYGPGAINGIINIVLKSAKDSPGASLGGKYMSKYNSTSGDLSYGYQEKNFNAYAFGSVAKTTGARNVDFFETASNGSYTGFLPNPAPYRGDGLLDNQKKFYFDAQLDNAWELWGRYSSMGDISNLLTDRMVYTYPYPAMGPQRQETTELYMVALNNKQQFNDQFDLKTDVTLQQMNFCDYYQNTTTVPLDVANGDSTTNPGNRYAEFGDRQYFFKTVGSYKMDKMSELSLGASFNFWDVMPIKGHDSVAMYWADKTTSDGQYFYSKYAKGFKTYGYGVFGEFNWELDPLLTIIASARGDRMEWSEWAFSPRLAMVSELNKTNVAKLIAQRSVRLPNIEDLLQLQERSAKGVPENLNSFELLYTNTDVSNWEFTGSANYSKSTLWGWVTGANIQIGEQNVVADNVEIGNLELEAKYKTEKATLGLNQAFAKLLAFSMPQNVARQGITYDVYHVTGLPAGTGILSFTNFCDNTTKVFSDVALLDSLLSVNASVEAFWNFRGPQDAIALYDGKYGLNDPTWNAIRKELYDKGVGNRVLYSVNLGISSKLPIPGMDLTASIYGLNVLGSMKRFNYSTGDSANYPAKIAWVDEPATVGVRLQTRF